MYSSLDSSFAAIDRANTTSDSFVLIIVSHSALISCVNTIHKTCHRVVKICNRGGNKIYWSSGQAVPRGFAALPVCSRLNCLNRQATQAMTWHIAWHCIALTRQMGDSESGLPNS